MLWILCLSSVGLHTTHHENEETLFGLDTVFDLINRILPDPQQSFSSNIYAYDYFSVNMAGLDALKEVVWQIISSSQGLHLFRLQTLY